MRLYTRPRRRPAPMGYFGQEVDPTDEMLAEPPSIEVYMSLLYVSMLKAKEGIGLAGDGNLEAAKISIFMEYPKGVVNPKSALGLWNHAGNMLKSLYHGGQIPEELFDKLSLSIGIPAYEAIGKAMEAISRGESGLPRMWDSWFGNFDAKADAFLKSQADKYVRLYRGIVARNEAEAVLIDSIKRNAPFLPNTVQALPLLEKDLKTGRTAQSALETAFAEETQITPAMLRGEQALGDVKAQVAKVGIKKLQKWLTPVLSKLGLSAAKSKWVTKIIYWTGKPLIWIVVKGAKYSTMLAGTYVIAWMFSKGSEDYAHFGGNPLALLAAITGRAKKDKEVAVKKGDKPAERGADEVISGAESAEKQGKAAVDSAKDDFPGEAVLYATGESDTTWVLYALGGGALAIGLYLYFSKKNSEPATV